MKQIYKDSNLEIIIPENYEDNLTINHNWCTRIKSQYDFHTEKLGQTLYRFIYNDGYILSLGVNKNDLNNGQWIDNVIDEKNKPTCIYLNYLKGNPFDSDKIMEIAKKYNNKNLENLSIKVSQISDEIKKLIL